MGAEGRQRSADELTVKEQRFLTLYLGEARGNATRAMRLAGYSGTDGGCAVEGSRMLRKPKIRARINEILEAEAIGRGELLELLRQVAEAPTTHFMQITRPADDETGMPMQVRQDYSAKIKAMELLMKYHGMLLDRQDVTSGGRSIAELVQLMGQHGA